MVAEGLLRDGALGEGCVAGVLAELWAGLEPESLLVDLGTGHGRVMM